MLAMHVYATDYGDRLPPNGDDDNDNDGEGFWINGNMRNYLDTWNMVNLADPAYNKLAPYTGRQGPGIYKCPGDKNTVDINGKLFPRIRSYSMNAAVGTILGQVGTAPDGTPVWGPWLDGSGSHVVDHPWRTYGKIKDSGAPGPGMVWMQVDEEEYSISLGCFNVSMETGPTQMINWPGTYHGNTASFSFLDGHAEVHKWRDSRTKNTGHISATVDGHPVKTPQGNPNNPDILWIQQHTSARAQ